MKRHDRSSPQERTRSCRLRYKLSYRTPTESGAYPVADTRELRACSYELGAGAYDLLFKLLGVQSRIELVRMVEGSGG